MKKMIPKVNATMPIIKISRAISFLNNDGGRLIEVVDFAMHPKKVKSPVRKTIAKPFPYVKLHPERAIFFASYNSICKASLPNLISRFSPVNEALFTLKS